MRFAACNTGISLLLHNNTAVISSKIKVYTNKKEKIVTSGHACAPTPLCDFVAKVTWEGKGILGGHCYICSSHSYNYDLTSGPLGSHQIINYIL